MSTLEALASLCLSVLKWPVIVVIALLTLCWVLQLAMNGACTVLLTSGYRCKNVYFFL